MDALKRISRVFDFSKIIPIDDTSKIIIMSDIHRGDGTWADDFLKNQNLYFAALSQYYSNNYTYIEIGDGDELWENRNMPDIIHYHSDAYWLLQKFYYDNRLYLIYGNHDINKRSHRFVRKELYRYFDQRQQMYLPLFPNVKVHEGLILNYENHKIFLLHGHQADFINNDLWWVTRFLVRYLWRPLNIFGIKNPTRAAKNYNIKISVDNALSEWVIRENKMLIAGHTHKPMFPETGDVPYFNSGSCVHPRCITGIEIVNGYIMLIKWSYKTRYDGTLYIGRDILAGPRKIKEYFK